MNSFNAWDYFSHILGKILISNIQFEELYRDLEDFFYNDFVQVVYLAPLYGFDTSLDNIKLNKDLEIRNLRSEEKWSLPNSDIYDPNDLVEDNVLRTPRFVIELKTKKKKHFEPGKIIFTNKSQFEVQGIEKLLTALRLFKEGAIGFPYILPSKMIDIPIPIEGRQININYMPDENYGQIYRLAENEISEFQNLWNVVDSMDHNYYNHNIKLAIDRFNSTYRKDSPGDKIIDYVVALESLCSK